MSCEKGTADLFELAENQLDVLVAGGGPAGLTAAWTAAAAGAKVAVVEREHDIGVPVHTSGAVTIQTMREFHIPECLYHPVTRLRICAPREAATFEFNEPFVCVIDVRGVYQHLASTAERSGAIVATGVQAVEPLLSSGSVVGCRLRRRGVSVAVRSKILIDATGYRAEISKLAGLHHAFGRFGVGAEYELVTPHCRQDELVLVVGNHYAPSGYAWVFPWGRGRVRIGVGLLHADTRANQWKLLKAFLDDAPAFGVDLRGHTMTEQHYGLIPASGLARRIARNGIMAVGDAAGVATLIVGEGIRLSMISGRLAGETAQRAIAGGRWDEAALKSYEKRFRAAYGLDLSIGDVINRRMAAWSDDQWDDRVRMLREFPPTMLIKVLESHFSAADVVGWIARRPALWPTAARSLAKGLTNQVRLKRGRSS